MSILRANDSAFRHSPTYLPYRQQRVEGFFPEEASEPSPGLMALKRRHVTICVKAQHHCIVCNAAKSDEMNEFKSDER